MGDAHLWLPGLGLEKANAGHSRFSSCKGALGIRLKSAKAFSGDGQCLLDDWLRKKEWQILSCQKKDFKTPGRRMAMGTLPGILVCSDS